MNLILLNSASDRQNLSAETPAAKHLRDVLKAKPGTRFWCGYENGARGIATIHAIDAAGNIDFFVEWEEEKSAETFSPPLRLLVGLSRPQTMKKVLAVASEIGCREINVFISQNGDPAYAQSSLWRDGNAEISAILKKSAEQTCTTALPQVRLFKNLNEACENLKIPPGTAVALDVYAQNHSFANWKFSNSPEEKIITLAIGSERGWSNNERDILKKHGFESAHLGARVLRVETAVAVVLAVASAKIFSWKPHEIIRGKSALASPLALVF